MKNATEEIMETEEILEGQTEGDTAELIDGETKEEVGIVDPTDGDAGEEDVELPQIEFEELTEEDAREFAKIEKRFIQAYHDREKTDTEGNWLFRQLRQELPEKPETEIREMTEEIRTSVAEAEKTMQDINAACEAGETTEGWFARKVSEAASGMSVMEFGNYLSGIDNALSMGNEQMKRTILTNAGEVSQCMNLDGFIAEQHAVNSFNRQAALEGSSYRAEVKVPGPGETYGRNSFDTVIKDTVTGETVHQYQFKFGKDAESTIKMLKEGNYNNQRIIVPEEQVEAVRKAFPGKTVEAYMGGTEKVPIKSDPLGKEQVKQIQHEAQEQGIMPEQNWNAYNTKELAMHVGKEAAISGVQAMAITTGFVMAEKAIKGEKIDADETLEIALRTGADIWVKEATAGAVKVGVEKGVIKFIPAGTPAGTIAKIVYISIEDIKILYKVAKGEMSIPEAMDEIGRTTVALSVGLGWAAAGAKIGVTLLGFIPFVGPAVGGLVGGTVGFIAGSGVGQKIYAGVKKVGKAVKSGVQKAVSKVKEVGGKIASGVGNFVSGVGNFFSSLLG